MQSKERCSEPALVRDVYAGPPPAKQTSTLFYVELVLEFADGEVQALGMTLPDHGVLASAIHQLAALFGGVGDLRALKGRPCLALRCWPERHHPLEGIEVEGRRFTVTRFLREHGAPLRASPMEVRVAQAEQERTVMALEFGRVYGEISNRITTLRETYVDWG